MIVVPVDLTTAAIIATVVVTLVLIGGIIVCYRARR